MDGHYTFVIILLGNEEKKVRADFVLKADDELAFMLHGNEVPVAMYNFSAIVGWFMESEGNGKNAESKE